MLPALRAEIRKSRRGMGTPGGELFHTVIDTGVIVLVYDDKGIQVNVIVHYKIVIAWDIIPFTTAQYRVISVGER